MNEKTKGILLGLSIALILIIPINIKIYNDNNKWLGEHYYETYFRFKNSTLDALEYIKSNEKLDPNRIISFSNKFAKINGMFLISNKSQYLYFSTGQMSGLLEMLVKYIGKDKMQEEKLKKMIVIRLEKLSNVVKYIDETIVEKSGEDEPVDYDFIRRLFHNPSKTYLDRIERIMKIT